MTRKECNRCGQVKDLPDFERAKQCRDGHRNYCKECGNAHTRDRYASKPKSLKSPKNPLGVRYQKQTWQKLHPGFVLCRGPVCLGVNPFGIGKTPDQFHANQTECKECQLYRSRIWYERKNGKPVQPRTRGLTEKEYYYKNREKMIAKTKQYITNRRRVDPLYRLKTAMGNALRKALRTKNGKAWERLLGYSTSDLRVHLESQFSEGMRWDNYGAWHIDHVIPIAAFNFTSSEDIDFHRCWSLDNLRPLWASDNIQKRHKLYRPFQPSFAFGGAS